MANKTIGRLWNDITIEIVSIDGKMFALNGWNGEDWGHCWEVTDKDGFDTVDNKQYEIVPVYEVFDEDTDQVDIVDYKLV